MVEAKKQSSGSRPNSDVLRVITFLPKREDPGAVKRRSAKLVACATSRETRFQRAGQNSERLKANKDTDWDRGTEFSIVDCLDIQEPEPKLRLNVATLDFVRLQIQQRLTGHEKKSICDNSHR